MGTLKKHLSLIVALLLIVSLFSGCGGGTTPTQESGETAAPATETPAADPGQEEAEEEAEEPAPQAEKELDLGFYNLDHYEQASGKKIESFKQAPMLDARVSSGELPPVEERLPKNPLVVAPWEEVGQYGGEARWMEFTIDYDHYLRHINTGRLVYQNASSVYHPWSGLAGPVSPGIWESWEISPDGTEYTIKIREGLKWSDGVEATTEDVKFYVEDILKNEELTPVAPQWLRWNEKMEGLSTEIEYLDKYTFRIKFAMPYGAFLQDLNNNLAYWNGYMRPAHYLKKFHTKYNDFEQIKPEMEKLGYDPVESEWPRFMQQILTGVVGGETIRAPYPAEHPTLNPYVVKEKRDDGTWIFERNPYYYAIDTEGNQLPYIDRLHRTYITERQMTNMAIIAGNTDFQCQFIQLADFPLFKENEEKGNYYVIPLKAWQHHMMIFPINFQTNDEEVNKIHQDVRFRAALSHALDRAQILESVFMGFGKPAIFAPPQGSPYYEEGMETKYAEYDPVKAKQLLDEIGLVDKDGDGWRDLPSGKPYIYKIDYYQVTPVADPGAEMAKRYFEDIGIRVEAKQMDGSAYWATRGANESMATVWWANGPQLNDRSFVFPAVPTPLWQQYMNTNGKEGVEPLPWAKRIWEIQDEMVRTASEEERIQLGKEGWRIMSDEIPFIGVVEGPKTPFVYSRDLGNIGCAEEKEFTQITVLEHFIQWFFKNPDRRN
jgi:peptide/nickel transport system substrate-binding protein